jgi:hypothetical protein
LMAPLLFTDPALGEYASVMLAQSFKRSIFRIERDHCRTGSDHLRSQSCELRRAFRTWSARLADDKIWPSHAGRRLLVSDKSVEKIKGAHIASPLPQPREAAYRGEGWRFRVSGCSGRCSDPSRCITRASEQRPWRRTRYALDRAFLVSHACSFLTSDYPRPQQVTRLLRARARRRWARKQQTHRAKLVVRPPDDFGLSLRPDSTMFPAHVVRAGLATAPSETFPSALGTVRRT